MAPAEPFVLEWQTYQIIKCLLEDEDEVECRLLDAAALEVDSSPAASNDDNFDPVLIADKLRSVADAMNEDAKFRAELTDLKKAAAQEAINAAFSHSVEAICKAQVSQRAEVAPEMQLLRASVAFGLYVKNSAPELKNKVQAAMSAFLNSRVGPWVDQQGGWDKVV